MRIILDKDVLTVIMEDNKKITKPNSEAKALFKALEIDQKQIDAAFADLQIEGNKENQVLHFGINLKTFEYRFIFSTQLDN